MSRVAEEFVWDHSPYEGTQKLIHLAVAVIVNEAHQWRYWGGDQALADKVGCSRQSVTRWKRSALEDGYLKPNGTDAKTGNKEYLFAMPGTMYQDVASPGQSGVESGTDATSRRADATSRSSAPLTTKKDRNTTQQLPLTAESAPAKRRQSSTLPSDFQITAAMNDWVYLNGYEYLDIQVETEKFRNHAACHDRRCKDWVAAWRNWIIGAAERTPRPNDRRDWEP